METFEEMANISLEKNPKKDEKISEIKRITDSGMNGEISIAESMSRRLMHPVSHLYGISA